MDRVEKNLKEKKIQHVVRKAGINKCHKDIIIGSVECFLCRSVLGYSYTLKKGRTKNRLIYCGELGGDK